MKWETPTAIDFRLGMEITLYIASRCGTGPATTGVAVPSSFLGAWIPCQQFESTTNEKRNCERGGVAWSDGRFHRCSTVDTGSRRRPRNARIGFPQWLPDLSFGEIAATCRSNGHAHRPRLAGRRCQIQGSARCLAKAARDRDERLQSLCQSLERQSERPRHAAESGRNQLSRR